MVRNRLQISVSSRHSPSLPDVPLSNVRRDCRILVLKDETEKMGSCGETLRLSFGTIRVAAGHASSRSQPSRHSVPRPHNINSTTCARFLKLVRKRSASAERSTMRLEDFVLPKLFDSLGLASNAKLFGEAQVCTYRSIRVYVKARILQRYVPLSVLYVIVRPLRLETC